AGFADKRQDLAALDRQVDAVDRPDSLRLDPAHDVAEVAADREVDLQIVDPEQLGHAGDTPSGAAAPRVDGAAATCAVALPATASMSEVGKRWQATRTPSEKRTSGGTTSVHTGIANSQRGANRQPGGGVRRSGGWPWITASWRRSPRRSGNEPTSLRV